MTDTRLPIDPFVRYFRATLDQVYRAYHWPVGRSGRQQATTLLPDFAWHDPSGGADECVALKHHLTTQWALADEVKRRSMARWIVAGWGGVRTNREATLNAHLLMALDETSHKPLKGVASYSKILSVIDCTRYAIYDARVAACLNAVQLHVGAENPLFFRYIPSRNNEFKSTGRAENFVTIFSKQKLVGSRHETAPPTGQTWREVPLDETYATYLSLLHSLKPHFPGKEIYHFEMALFSEAPTLCAQLTRRYRAIPAQ